MASLPRLRRHRALLPACDRLESRELLSGTSSHDVQAVEPPHAEFAKQATEHARKFHGPIIGNLTPNPNASFSTVPSNGDVNPYGVAVVPNGFAAGGTIQAGDVLVSNWNNSSNVQGTGTTIVSIGPGGSQSVFYQAPQGSGLSTALGVLKRGFVIVGNVPASYSATTATPDQGSLMILDKSGNLVANLTNASLLDGPWDLTINDQGNRTQVFVSNVVSGTVTRIDLKIHGSQVAVQDMVQIGSGYGVRPDPAALIVGPTGLAFDPKKDVLYVASTDDNSIYAISNALHTRAGSRKRSNSSSRTRPISAVPSAWCSPPTATCSPPMGMPSTRIHPGERADRVHPQGTIRRSAPTRSGPGSGFRPPDARSRERPDPLECQRRHQYPRHEGHFRLTT